MTPGDHKLRISLAVFESAAVLGRAIEALLAEGVPLARVGLIALRSTAQAMLAPELSHPPGTAAAGALAALLGSLACLGSETADSIMASPGLLAPWRAGLRAPALWANAAALDPWPRLAADLERHVRRGAAILSVESSTPSQQWRCARILLEQSSSPVLAIECSPTPAT